MNIGENSIVWILCLKIVNILIKTWNSVINRNRHKKEFILEKERKKQVEIELRRDLISGLAEKNTNNY